MSKASKRRNCPAVGREITSGECGAKRVSEYPCPSTCPHNPFAPSQYNQLREIESGLDRKSIERLGKGSFHPAAIASEIGEDVPPDALVARISWRLFFARPGGGATFAEEWEKTGLPGLKNDERVLWRAKMGVKIALLEVHRVIDNETVEAVDLLAGEESFLVVDRSLASRAVRFMPLFCWLYRLPHFCRLAGDAAPLPDITGFSPVEILHEIIRHLGGPRGGEPLSLWLAENFTRVTKAVLATEGEIARQRFASMDAYWGTAVYELRSSYESCRKLIDGVPGIQADEIDEEERLKGFEEARIWFDQQNPGAIAHGGRTVLGRVLLGRTEWRAEAMGKNRLARMREGLEARMGDKVSLKSERVDDIAAQIAGDTAQEDGQLVPPRLLLRLGAVEIASSRIEIRPDEHPEDAGARMAQGQLHDFLSHKIPALDGRTPREAAADAHLRPRLLRLIKGHIRSFDEINLKKGRSDDINWIVRELGLVELDFPPPPPRAMPEEDTDEEGGDELGFEQPFEDRTPPPPLPPGAFGLEEASERMLAALTQFPAAADGMRELEASGSTLMMDAQELTEDLLDEDGFSLLVPLLLLTWFAMVPRGCLAPILRLEAMRAAVPSELEGLSRDAAEGRARSIERLMSSCHQPGILQCLMARLFAMTEKLPRKMRRPAASEVPIVIILKTVLDELDHALRSGVS